MAIKSCEWIDHLPFIKIPNSFYCLGNTVDNTNDLFNDPPGKARFGVNETNTKLKVPFVNIFDNMHEFADENDEC